MVTLFLLVALAHPLEPRLTPFFAESSYLEANGTNVVNVILVDFRSLDTLGEIGVVSIAAIGIIVLLRLRLNGKAEDGDEAAHDAPAHHEDGQHTATNEGEEKPV
jgi:multicomponent Na+:H+ antiporter subunit A